MFLMTLKIENEDIEILLEEIVTITGESKTGALRKALEERRQRLAMSSFNADGRRDLLSFLQDEIWPQIPPELLGTRLTKAEEENILGYGEDLP
jgi:antitoxin VapB